MDHEERIKELEEKNAKLEEELQATKDHLKKYTAPARNKKHYEANKEVIKSRGYKKSVVSPEKRKEYARQAYLNKKEKMKKLKENNETI